MSEHFTPQGPYSAGGTFSNTNANNIEAGIEAVDNAKADLSGAAFTGALSGTSATFSSTARAADFRGASGEGAIISDDAGNARVAITPTTGPRGIEIQAKDGSQNAINAVVVDTAGGVTLPNGATFGSAITGTTATFSGHLIGNDATLTAANAGLEMGDTTTVNTPHIDGHSSGGAEDFTQRITFSGGTAGVNGSGTIALSAASVTRNGNRMLDTTDALGFLQLDAANEAATPVRVIISDTTPAAGVKGRILIKVPFALP